MKANPDCDALNAEDLCSDQTFINAIHLLADSFLTAIGEKLHSNKVNENTNTHGNVAMKNDPIIASVSKTADKTNVPKKARLSRDRRRGKKQVIIITVLRSLLS